MLLLLLCGLSLDAAQKLLVISVDGLDQRYLAKRDENGLKIPNIRKLIAEGQWSDGVIGLVPTVTWPSHTNLISGVGPSVHGIPNNRLPGGDYPWSAKLLKARTLLDAAHAAGKTTATITWPVTVDGPVDFNLPEYFQRRRGGAMDLRSIESKSQPADLGERIRKMFPSFAQEWMDDRTRTLAVVYLLKTEQPDLILLHLVDLDSEAHDNGPFTSEANAVLEYTDELIGQMMAALPAGYAVALVSDHGFERIESVVRIDVKGARTMGYIAVADTPEAAAALRSTNGVGREIPAAEVAKYAPQLATAAAVFESAPGVEFGTGTKPREAGNHGHWPARYRAVYVLWGTGERGEIPEMQQTDIALRLAHVLGIEFKPGPK